VIKQLITKSEEMGMSHRHCAVNNYGIQKSQTQLQKVIQSKGDMASWSFFRNRKQEGNRRIILGCRQANIKLAQDTNYVIYLLCGRPIEPWKNSCKSK
jgi:hypothetical protein